jgi:protein O-mannosyl-transferase
MLAGGLFWICLILGWLALSQGLGGNFIFDDSWNLRGLERIKNNPVWREALDFSVTGISSTLGRPLALASFAAQYRSWPWHPGDFIYVNILIHLLNACLLLWALVRLTRLQKLSPGIGLWIAMFATASWMLSPLQASAVLYIVQRMAVLAGTCMLLGLLVYLVGRKQLASGQWRWGLLWMSVGIAIGAGLGTLSKENAVLFPLGLLVMEFTLLRNTPRTGPWAPWGSIFLLAPTLLVMTYVAISIPQFLLNEVGRNFTLYERLLSETRILFLYLYKLFVPSLYSIRLLYDDLQVSRGLLDPWTTLVSAGGWIVLLTLALRLRRQAPVLSFGILWFLSHHMLESTVVPLELAFEHRNYVASAGPAFTLGWYLRTLLDHPVTRRIQTGFRFSIYAYVAFLLIALWQSAALWGRPIEQMRYWAHTQPNSVRAQLQLADIYLAHYEIDSTVAVLEATVERWPGDPTAAIAIMEIGCHIPEGPVPSLSSMREIAGRFDAQVLSVINVLDRLISTAELGQCNRYGPAELYSLVEILAELPEFHFQQRNLYLMHSRIAELARDRAAARHFLDKAIALSPVMPLLIQATVWALQAGEVAHARHYAELARGQHSFNPFKQWNNYLLANELSEIVEQFERDHDKTALSRETSVNEGSE